MELFLYGWDFFEFINIYEEFLRTVIFKIYFLFVFYLNLDLLFKGSNANSYETVWLVFLKCTLLLLKVLQ